jgi:hypothetical protein
MRTRNPAPPTGESLNERVDRMLAEYDDEIGKVLTKVAECVARDIEDLPAAVTERNG